MSRVEQRETGIWLFRNTEILPSLIHQPPTLISPGLPPVVFQPRKSVCVCVCWSREGMGSALFANTVQPNRRQIAFCGGVCPVPMAEFVRFVPLDNKSCHPP